MKEVRRFLNYNDVSKDAVKKIVPTLADRDDFHVECRYNLPCPSCEEQMASGLFYRIFNQMRWLLAGEIIKCSVCRDKEALRASQKKGLEELRLSVGERLKKEYFHIPGLLKEAGFNNYKEITNVTAVAKERAVSFTQTFLSSKGKCHNLLIMGNPGTGKSHLSTAVARNILSKGFTVGFLMSGKLLSMVKETYQKGATQTEAGILRDISKLDLLILDDVGSEAMGGNDDWRKRIIFEIVESRSGKPTIYTSNLTDADLPAAVGKRVFSRLYNNTKFIDLFTEDYRENLRIK